MKVVATMQLPAPDVARDTRLADYLELTKPRVAVLVLVTVVVGAVVASGGTPDFWRLLHAVLGTAFVAAAGSALNQYLERDTDAQMRRTRNRPLPTGRLAPAAACRFAAVLAIGGLAYLALAVNVLTAVVGAVTFVLYVFAYTPLKRRTSLNTLVGAVPGALPPVMGWAAVRGSLDPEAGLLFLIVFLWQFPHFLAIAWLYREDYARAGLKMLPVVDWGGKTTGRQMVSYTMALVPVSLAPSALGLAGPVYFFGALALSTLLLACCLSFTLFESRAKARYLLRASLVYLPLLMALLMLDVPAV